MRYVSLLVMTLLADTSIGAEADEALLQAIKQRDLARVETLLDQGANPNGDPEAKRDTLTPLMLAVGIESEAMVLALLEHGADPNASLTEQRPMHLAASRRVDILRLLLRFGGDPDATTSLGYTPLSQVAGCWPEASQTVAPGRTYLNERRKCEEALELLLAANAKINVRGYHDATPLFEAIDRLNVPFVLRLLEAGADPNWTNQLQESPLARAFLHYIDSSTRKTRLEFDRRTPAQRAQDNRKIFEVLLEHGASPNFVFGGEFRHINDGDVDDDEDVDGYTLLGLAARYGWLDTAALLLAKDADPSTPRGDGALPADIAELHGHLRTAELIRKHARRKSATR
jgi:ankyrin repeat protein